MRTSLVLVLALLSGCWVSNDEIRDRLDAWNDAHGDTGDTSDTDVLDDTGTAVALHILDVDPPFGSSAGGTTVTLVVQGLDGALAVAIGGVDADIQSVNGDRVVVASPPGSPGTANVTVTSGDRTSASPGAFEYYPDATGENGVLGAVHWNHYVGDYWGGGTPASYGYSWLGFVAPTPLTWRELVIGPAGADQCQLDFVGSWPDFVDLAVDSVDLRTAGGLALPHELDDDLTFRRDLEPAEFRADSSFGLDPIDTDALPGFTVDAIARTPRAFDVTYPTGFTDGDSLPYVVRSNLFFQWTAGSPGDHMVLILERSGPRSVVDPTSTLKQTVTCTMTDDGEFKVPDGVWGSSLNWAPGYQMIVRMGRVRTSGAVLPHDNASSGVVGVYWNIGGVSQGF